MSFNFSIRSGLHYCTFLLFFMLLINVQQLIGGTTLMDEKTLSSDTASYRSSDLYIDTDDPKVVKVLEVFQVVKIHTLRNPTTPNLHIPTEPTATMEEEFRTLD